jgi:hypothetical protein
MSRSDPCAIALPRGAPSAPPDRQVVSIDRRAPIYVVEIEGTDLAQAAMAGNVEQVLVEESCGVIPVARVVLYNERLRLTDDALFREGNRMTIRTGYPLTGLEKRGTFILAAPRFAFRKGKEPTITLTAYGEQILLAREQKRRVFKKRRDSDIAEEIAGEHGFAADVERTDPVHEQVAQMNETDAQLLLKRARLHGYELSVRDGTLHFHPPRFEDSGVQILYDKGEKSGLGKLDVTARTHLMGAEFRASQIDPLKKEVFDLASREVPDPITKEVQGRSREPLVMARELASVDGRQPVIFLTGEGHEQTREQVERQNEAYSQHTRWLVEGEGEAIGLEKVRAGTMIEILGIGRIGGWYLITAARHDISAGYRLVFSVRRAWHGAPGASAPARAPQTSSAGSRAPARGGLADVTAASPRAGVFAMGRA